MNNKLSELRVRIITDWRTLSINKGSRIWEKIRNKGNIGGNNFLGISF
jgi:hypothetical protein